MSVLKEVATIGLALTKTPAHIEGSDASGQVLTRRRCSKGQYAEITAKMDPFRNGMEDCRGTHGPGCQLLGPGATWGWCVQRTSRHSSSSTSLGFHDAPLVDLWSRERSASVLIDPLGANSWHKRSIQLGFRRPRRGLDASGIVAI